VGMAAEGSSPTRIMLSVSQSNVRGYPHPSLSSRAAFEWIVKKIIRENTSGFKLLLLHVEVPDLGGYDGTGNSVRAPQLDRNRIGGGHLLDYFIRQCREIGVECEAWIGVGDPKEVICHEAKRVQPDFLVVGSRGLGPFQKVFIGTVSEFCVKHADCPVISIRRSAAQTPSDPADD
ncbi:universal stress protein family protein, partial [Genlisea aurea]